MRLAMLAPRDAVRICAMPPGARSPGRSGSRSTHSSVPMPAAASSVATVAPTRAVPCTATVASWRIAKMRAAAPGPGLRSDSESRSGSRRWRSSSASAGCVSVASSSTCAALSVLSTRGATSAWTPLAAATSTRAATSRLPSSSASTERSGAVSPLRMTACAGVRPSCSVDSSRQTRRNAGLSMGRIA